MPSTCSGISSASCSTNCTPWSPTSAANCWRSALPGWLCWRQRCASRPCRRPWRDRTSCATGSRRRSPRPRRGCCWARAGQSLMSKSSPPRMRMYPGPGTPRSGPSRNSTRRSSSTGRHCFSSTPAARQSSCSRTSGRSTRMASPLPCTTARWRWSKGGGSKRRWPRASCRRWSVPRRSTLASTGGCRSRGADRRAKRRQPHAAAHRPR